MWVCGGRAAATAEVAAAAAVGRGPTSLLGRRWLCSSSKWSTRKKGAPTPQMYCIPDPQKREKGGEDALFFTHHKYCISHPPKKTWQLSYDHGVILGVADGVGGWAEMGVDPSKYSRGFMEGCCEVLATTNRPVDLRTMLHAAYRDNFRNRVRGSCTVCLVQVKGNKLETLNVGDSGYMIVRDGKLLFKSEEQQYKFNFPYQLGEGGSRLSVAQRGEHDILPGDMILVATDGVFDNLYDDELVNIVSGPFFNVAEQVAKAASVAAHDDKRDSPFTDAWNEGTMRPRRSGGKLDDIACVFAKVGDC